VRYVGEPIAVVLAETMDLAQDAIAAIEVGTTHCLRSSTRTAATAVRGVFRQARDNLAMTLSGVMGDTDRPFRQAEYVRSEVFRIQAATGSGVLRIVLPADSDSAATVAFA